MRIAFTGHRPDRLTDRIPHVERVIMEFLRGQSKVTHVISGMAQGTDMIAAKVALYLNIPLIAAVPWIGHGSHWPREQQDEYTKILEGASEVVVTSPTDVYSVSVYSIRNRWMVDNGDHLASIWDGEKDGGTWDAIAYAASIKRPTTHLQWR